MISSRVLSGSSPHTWGILGKRFRKLWPLRFIPTYVGHTWPSTDAPPCSAVHPHIRGAYDLLVDSGHVANRFIPTYVGHTNSVLPGGGRETVHPHIRGAYRRGRASTAYSYGSSPHTWGIRPRRYSVRAACTVHPHIRGAYCRRVWCWSIHRGSSPHTWGIQKAPLCWRTAERFIPTYVGHTCQIPVRQNRNPVHPHIRGAYMPDTSKLSTKLGSSPHTWGILDDGWTLEVNRRFIPTYVGHTTVCPYS